MNAQQNLAFGQLLAAWRRREEARGLDIRQLADARFGLEQARADMRGALAAR